MPFAFARDARLTYGAAGLVLAAGAPLGWLALTALLGAPAEETLYAYLGGATALVFTAFGVTLGHLHEKLKQLAERDDLTGLYNQNAFLSTASFLLQLAIRHKEPLSVMMMDIDHFKDVNDHHNHLVGSHVLKEIAWIVQRSTRKSDLTARFGGDEYILCLPRTDAAEAYEVAERIRKRIEEATFVLRSHSVRVTVSIGVATASGGQGLDLARVIESADSALYDAKDRGRNRVVGVKFETPALQRAG